MHTIFKCALILSALLATGCKKDVELADYSDLTVNLPGDPLWNDLWGMIKIEAPTAWGSRTDCSGKVVAVLDTGIQYGHADLASNIWSNTGETAGNATDDDGNGYTDDIRGYDFVTPDADPDDDHGHGTHVAGTIGAVGNNGVGVAGVCWTARIMPVKVMASDGSGDNVTIATGVDYARANGANVISMSIGGSTANAILRTAIETAASSNILVIAAAGNSGRSNDSTPFYPASYPGVVAVAATGSKDALASFSNYGTSSVHIAAPGVEIKSTYIGGAYASQDGTSMATPHVAGAATWLWAKNPTWNANQVRHQLMENSAIVEGLANTVNGARRLRMGSTL